MKSFKSRSTSKHDPGAHPYLHTTSNSGLGDTPSPVRPGQTSYNAFVKPPTYETFFDPHSGGDGADNDGPQPFADSGQGFNCYYDPDNPGGASIPQSGGGGDPRSGSECQSDWMLIPTCTSNILNWCNQLEKKKALPADINITVYNILITLSVF